MFSAFLRLYRKDLAFFDASLPLHFLSKKGEKAPLNLPFPLTSPNVLFTFSGSAALYQAVRALDLSAKDTVLCPAYNCGHEVEPILRQQIPVRFYAVNTQMVVDLEDLERKIDSHARAVLITHYFGFPQPTEEIRGICDRYGLYLIEDCAHAFLSRGQKDYLGTRGDLAVFSMRKTIPIPNGGALVVNKPSVQLSWNPAPPPLLSTWSKILELWLKEVTRENSPSPFLFSRFTLPLLAPIYLGRHVMARYRIPGDLAWFDPDDERFDFDSQLLEWRMAEVGNRIIKKIDFDLVAKKRRENFQHLLSSLLGLEGVRPVYECLPEGVCPLFFPLLVFNSGEMVRSIYKEGITSSTWWRRFHPSVPWDEFPTAVYLKDHVMVLPVHQDLSPIHIQRMVNVIRKIFSPKKVAFFTGGAGRN